MHLWRRHLVARRRNDARSEQSSACAERWLLPRCFIPTYVCVCVPACVSVLPCAWFHVYKETPFSKCVEGDMLGMTGKSAVSFLLYSRQACPLLWRGPRQNLGRNLFLCPLVLWNQKLLSVSPSHFFLAHTTQNADAQETLLPCNGQRTLLRWDVLSATPVRDVARQSLPMRVPRFSKFSFCN